MSQTMHWKKLDHVTFALMLPFIVREFFEHDTWNMVAITILWSIALFYDLYEHYMEER
ncbi:MAG: hypothetical protein ABIH90_01300 [Candidatus Aenigmatarchaeota archaeon]